MKCAVKSDPSNDLLSTSLVARILKAAEVIYARHSDSSDSCWQNLHRVTVACFWYYSEPVSSCNYNTVDVLFAPGFQQLAVL